MNFTIEVYQRGNEKKAIISPDLEECRSFLEKITDEETVERAIRSLKRQKSFPNVLLFLEGRPIEIGAFGR